MAYQINLPRFVKVTSAQYFAGSPKADTLYFLTDLGVIYEGSTLMTKGVQTDNTVKVPGLFYVLGSGKDAQIVTYAAADAEPTVIAISENAIDGKISGAVSAAVEGIDKKLGEGFSEEATVKAAIDAAKKAGEDAAAAVAKDLTDNYSDTEAVNGLIDGAIDELSVNGKNFDENGAISLAAGDIAYTPVAEGAVAGATVQAAIEAIDEKLSAISGGEDGDSLASLALRIGEAEGDIDAINEKIGGSFDKDNTVAAAIDAKVSKETGKELASTEDIAKWNTTSATVATYGDIVTHNAAEFEVAGAASDVADAINAKLGGNFGTEEGQQTVDAAIKAVDAKFASYSTTEQVDGKINAALSSVLKFKGVVADKAALDAITGMVEGDVYYVTAESKEFVYVDEDGKKGWEELGATVDYEGMLAPYLLIGETFTDGQILVAAVDGEAKSAVTSGYKVGGAALEDAPAATTLATEKAVADLVAQMAWQTTMD